MNRVVIFPQPHRVRPGEDALCTRRYHDPDPGKLAFGGRAEIALADGAVLADDIAVADAHPAGERPFTSDQDIAKFRALADGVIAPDVQDRFFAAVPSPDLDAG